ncbi:adenylosuccinate lyase [Anaerosacchariphilus polymeriproducens]|uniref:Adenylosuccinate lyase n=1 Tax=Anaerosacchariphilus polymeriproducens TaxID=1812858 RepID=A0A371AY22_9FIRM|nr:adenylosuccinate lyase [Anaerosacchariphilus polymeriproducens]RDU24402.1 adenylosuccinate lyase [Anaerosacchariphilus polymeriproducens]
MPISFLDYEIQEDVYSTPEMKKLFDEKARFQRWLNIEAALAVTQSEFGIIPVEAAEEIHKKCKLQFIDMESLKDEYKVNRNSIVPLLKELKKVCDNKYGQYVHYGATTQDIVDTGQILEVKEILEVVSRDLNEIERILVDLAKKHSNTPMIGRSHGQYGIPITFGLKVSIWISEIRRHIKRFDSLKERVLVGQLSGAVGTRAALGDKANNISQETLKKLGLDFDMVPWHTSRDNMAELGSCIAILAGSIAKIANEIFFLGRSDVMEVREGKKAKISMGSSTMPHKQNPVLCERIVVLFKHIKALSSITVESTIHENERDPRSLWAEWLAFPQMFVYVGTMLSYILDVLNNLEVNEEKMKENLYKIKELVTSEYILFKLGKHIGKMNAQEKLHEIVEKAEKTKKSFRETLLADDVSKYLTEEDRYIMSHPENYIGETEEIVQAVINY